MILKVILAWFALAALGGLWFCGLKRLESRRWDALVMRLRRGNQ